MYAWFYNFYYDKIILLGGVNMDILWIQKDLNFLGYNAGPEDGKDGPKTRARSKEISSWF